MKTNAFLTLFLITNLAFAAPSNTLTISPYVDVTLDTHWSQESQSIEPMDYKKIAVDNHIKELHLAFIVDSASCAPAWGGLADYSLATTWGKNLTDGMAKEHIDITVAFGGALGNDLSMNCSSKSLEDIFKDTVDNYHAKKLDFDIENGTTNVPKLIESLKNFQKDHQDIKLSFTLPTLPDGLTPSGEDVLRQAVQAGIDFNVNIMAMDYGPAYTEDMAISAIKAGQSLHSFLKKLYPEKNDRDCWQLIEITPMIGVNDSNPEQFTLQNAKTLSIFARQQHLGGLAMWSLNRDKPCSNGWASFNCSGNNLQTHDYEFVHALMGE